MKRTGGQAEICKKLKDCGIEDDSCCQCRDGAKSREGGSALRLTIQERTFDRMLKQPSICYICMIV